MGKSEKTAVFSLDHALAMLEVLEELAFSPKVTDADRKTLADKLQLLSARLVKNAVPEGSAGTRAQILTGPQYVSLLKDMQLETPPNEGYAILFGKSEGTAKWPVDAWVVIDPWRPKKPTRPPGSAPGSNIFEP